MVGAFRQRNRRRRPDSRPLKSLHERPAPSIPAKPRGAFAGCSRSSGRRSPMRTTSTITCRRRCWWNCIAASVPVVLTLHDLKLVCPAYKMHTQGAICESCRGGALRNVVRNRCIKNSTAMSALVWLESTVHKALDIYMRNVTRFVVPSRFLPRQIRGVGHRYQPLRAHPEFHRCRCTRGERGAG